MRQAKDIVAETVAKLVLIVNQFPKTKTCNFVRCLEFIYLELHISTEIETYIVHKRENIQT